jgi:thymidylate synthase
MTVVFRSHDMLSAYGANVYGLAHMQKLICDEINELSINKITIGTLTTISSSAHIYWKRDKQELNEFKKRMIL